MINQFFNNHLEVLFLKFDLGLIEKILQLLEEGLSDPIFDV